MAKLVDATVIVASGTTNEPVAQAIYSRLRSLGLRVWSITDDVAVGDSKIRVLDEQLCNAAAMVLIRSSGAEADNWAELQEFGFRARLTRSSNLKLILIPREENPIDGSVYGHALVLPTWLDANQAAELSAAAIRFNRHLSSMRLRPPDNPNAPLLSAAAWPLQSPESEFNQSISKIMSSNGRINYDDVSDLYWKTLHFSGYRGQWDVRLALSTHMVRLTSRERDPVNRGLVLSKGIAYAHLTRGDYNRARRVLKAADRAFRDAKDQRGPGFCWSYLGDIEARQRRLSSALDCYAEAADALSGLEQHNVVLKNRTIEALYGDDITTTRLRSLRRLRKDLNAVHNYRAGIIDMAIAETLSKSGDHSQAIAHAEQAVSLFRDIINMPRNTR